MGSPLLGLHHVTATVDDAQTDLDFAVGVLALRLVKKTVNFDNPFVYHFYYGDAAGSPGTIWTTFPYRGHGVRPGRIGAGQIIATSFSVPNGSLPFWRNRLRAAGVSTGEETTRFGEAVATLHDPSGLTMELVEATHDPREPWIGSEVGSAEAIRGIHGVTLASRSATATIDFLTSALGFSLDGHDGDRARLSVGGSGPGHLFDVIDGHGRQPGLNGLGTVHHVALAVASDAEQLEMRTRLLDLGATVTPVQDRHYFQSIYFREPGGILLEIATTAPGFSADESPDRLGRALKLPAWEEDQRRTIEAGLSAVIHPDDNRH